MYINWSTQVSGPGGLLIPTYGNYGGPGYSDGQILADPNQPVAYDAQPVDALDALFLTHDQAYDSQSTMVRAEGDLVLAEGIAALPDDQLDAEASLYGGFAILFAIQQLVLVNQHPELLAPRDFVFLTHNALDDIQQGLAESSPTELAALANWLEQSAGSETVADLADPGQVFDFGQLAHSTSHRVAVLLDHADGLLNLDSAADLWTSAQTDLASPPVHDDAQPGLQDLLSGHHHAGVRDTDLFT